MTVSNLDGGAHVAAHVCNGSFAANFTQSFSTFDGAYSAGTVTCVTGGTTKPIGLVSGPLGGDRIDIEDEARVQVPQADERSRFVEI